MYASGLVAHFNEYLVNTFFFFAQGYLEYMLASVIVVVMHYLTIYISLILSFT